MRPSHIQATSSHTPSGRAQSSQLAPPAGTVTWPSAGCPPVSCSVALGVGPHQFRRSAVLLEAAGRSRARHREPSRPAVPPAQPQQTRPDTSLRPQSTRHRMLTVPTEPREQSGPGSWATQDPDRKCCPAYTCNKTTGSISETCRRNPALGQEGSSG